MHPHQPTSRYDQYTPLLCNQVDALKKISKGEIAVTFPKLALMKRPPKKGPYCKFHQAKGNHTNECVVLRDSLEVEARKGNLNALLETKEKADPPVAVVETQDAQP